MLKAIWRWNNWHRNTWMVKTVVTYTPYKSTAYCAQPTGSHYHVINFSFFDNFTHSLSWSSILLDEPAFQLPENKRSTFQKSENQNILIKEQKVKYKFVNMQVE